VVGAFASVSQIAYVVLGPMIAIQSDRHRGRYGRRRPFLLGSTPFVVLALLLIGGSDHVGAALYHEMGRCLHCPKTP